MISSGFVNLPPVYWVLPSIHELGDPFLTSQYTVSPKDFEHCIFLCFFLFVLLWKIAYQFDVVAILIVISQSKVQQITSEYPDLYEYYIYP